MRPREFGRSVVDNATCGRYEARDATMVNRGVDSPLDVELELDDTGDDENDDENDDEPLKSSSAFLSPSSSFTFSTSSLYSGDWRNTDDLSLEIEVFRSFSCLIWFMALLWRPTGLIRRISERGTTAT